VVAVFGGGVGGLSAAHELAERGFTVKVYERRKEEEFGGKARSIPVPNTKTGDRPALPGEHGFRFFPSFYWHLPDTMKRIPDGSGHRVYHHLRDTEEMMMAQTQPRGTFPMPTPKAVSSLDDPAALAAAINALWQYSQDVHVKPEDVNPEEMLGLRRQAAAAAHLV